MAIFREDATSTLAGFQAGPLSRSNCNLEMLVFQEGGKPENPEKNPRSKARTNNKLNPRMEPGRNRTRATLVRGKCSHHCANPAPLYRKIEALKLGKLNKTFKPVLPCLDLSIQGHSQADEN